MFYSYFSGRKGLVTEQAEPTAISCKLDADRLLLYFYSRSQCSTGYDVNTNLIMSYDLFMC